MKRMDLFILLTQTWPKLRIINRYIPGNVMLMDNEYAIPESSEIEKIIWFRPWWKFWALPPYEKERHDCDEFGLLAYEIRQAYRKKGALAFGLACGDRFEYISCFEPHALNILMCTDGPWLYDHQRQKYWKADPDADSVYFVMI